MGPFLFKDGHEDEVELVEERSLGFDAILCARGLDNEVNDEISNAYQPF